MTRKHKSETKKYGLGKLAMMRRVRLLPLVAIALLGLGSIRGRTQEAATEYQVKAAYLFNFTKFVEWPEEPDDASHAPWLIGIVGENPFSADATQLVSGKTAQGHELKLKVFQETEDFRGCRVLFISASEKKRLPLILAALRNSSVLTVADMDGFLQLGGMIQFVTEEKRIRFGVDLTATSRAGIKISSKLLAIARSVTSADKSGSN